MLSLFSGWRTRFEIDKWLTVSQDSDVRTFFNQLSGLITDIFLPLENEMSREVYRKLLPFNSLITYSYYLSDGNSDDLIGSIGDRSILIDKEKVSFKVESDLYKYLLLINPSNSESISTLVKMARKEPQAVHFAYLHSLSNRTTSDPVIQKNRNFLTENIETLKGIKLSPLAASNAHLLWAVSSYESQENNYLIKEFLNKLLRKSIRDRGFSLNPKTKYLDLSTLESVQKPKILIPAEVFNHNHVMYRCFHRSLQALARDFYLIVMTAEEDLGEFEWDWCDDLFTFKQRKFALNIEIDRIQKLQPDIVLYPSIGMRLWSLLLSRVRIAPLQICMMGHPDSPHANEIDYCVLGKSLVSEKMKFPGNVKVTESPGSLFDFKYDAQRPQPTINNDPEVIRLVCCANIFKLSPLFLETCQKIAQHSYRKVEFHFMQNLNGIQYQVGKKQILNGLPNSIVKVYPILSRPQYYQALDHCDVYLSPFPFGGENSTMDAALVGLPTVSLIGDGPLNRLDYRILKTLNLDDRLVAKNIEEYITTALKLIENDKFRISISEEILSKDPQSIFEKETRSHESELTGIIKELYHEKYEKESGQ